MRKFSIENLSQEFTKRGWKLTSTEYSGSQKPLDAICPNGHETKVNWNNFQKGQGCRFCAGNVKYDYELVRKTFEDRGCKLLEETYTNNLKPLRYICKCGTESVMRFADFLRGRSCQKCKGETNSQKLRTSNDTISEICNAAGCKLLRAWIQNRKTRIEYICKCGNQTEAYLTNFKNYPNCKKCGAAKISGDKCHMYDPDRAAVAMRKKFRKVCGQHIRRFMEATAQKKTRHTHELLGYTPLQLQNHILNHPNYESCKGKVWHVDHIFPLQAFLDHHILDLKIINALDNLRPLIGPENLSKADKYDEQEFLNWVKGKLQ